MTDSKSAVRPSGREDVRALVEQFIEKAERYRLHSELLFDSSTQITMDMLLARDALRDALLIRETPPAEPEGPQDAIRFIEQLGCWWKRLDDSPKSFHAMVGGMLEAWEIRSASRETPPGEASPQEHARPVGCPAQFYDGLTLEQGLNVTRAFFAGMSAVNREAATPASAEASKEQ